MGVITWIFLSDAIGHLSEPSVHINLVKEATNLNRISNNINYNMPFSSSDNIRRYHSTSQMSKFDSDASSLDETLANLTLILKQKQQTLEEREHEINRKAAALESAKSQLFGDKSPSDVLHLNVGGTCIAVLRRTLTSVEGSMLASRFSGR